MTDYKQPKVTVVCAACRCPDKGTIFVGPRHFDETMWQVIKLVLDQGYNPAVFEQGFIDQRGNFLTREEAMRVVRENGQPFNAERNSGSGDELYSEGLY
jgi:hypothetical protein